MIKDNFWNVTGFHRWVSSPSNKSFRKIISKKGLFIIVHRNTGQFFVKVSNNVSADVDKDLELLNKRKHKIKIFNRLMDFDEQLEILEFNADPKSVKNILATLKHNLKERCEYLWRT